MREPDLNCHQNITEQSSAYYNRPGVWTFFSQRILSVHLSLNIFLLSPVSFFPAKISCPSRRFCRLVYLHSSQTPCCKCHMLLRWSPPTFNSLLRQFEGTPAFPALWAVSEDAWRQCLLKPQVKLVFRDHLCAQAEGVPRTVGSLRHPISANHVYHKSWTMSVRFALHSLHNQGSKTCNSSKGRISSWCL
jgi:hypothetical protein